MISWLVFAVVLSSSPAEPRRFPCGHLSPDVCMDTAIGATRNRVPEGTIRAIAVHKDDWDQWKLSWDYQTNTVKINSKDEVIPYITKEN